MPVDLETRLRDYGQVLDRAADGGVVAVPLRPRRPRSYGALLAAAAIVVVTGAAATLTLLRERSAGVAHGPTSTVVAQQPGEPVTAADVLPVQLAEGVVPWYVLASEDAASFEPLAVDVELACSQWWVPVDTVQCLTVVARDFQPQVAYADVARESSITVSTVHVAGVDAQQYSDAFAEQHPLDPIGTMTTPVELSGGRFAIHTSGNDDSNQRVTFAAAPDTLVAVTARNLDREELLAIAGRLVPADDVPPLPLLLAVPDSWRSQPAEAPVWLLGGVVDGEVCAFGTAPGIPDASSACHRLGSEPVMVIDRGEADGVYSGLVSRDVHDVGLLFHLDVLSDPGPPLRLTTQPVGEVQAFVARVPGPPAIALRALGAGGRELRVIDLYAGAITRPAPTRSVESCSTYTVEHGDTPASIAERHGVTVAELLVLNPGVSASGLLVGTSVDIPCVPVG